jgi:hypothetical protein
MMSGIRILDSAEHRRALLELVGACTSKFEVVSPWMTDSMVKMVLDAKPATTDIAFTFRWPDQDDSPSLYPLDILKHAAALHGVEFWVVGTQMPLHSKIYLDPDRRAIVTSANLTDAAFSHNHETGVLISDRALVSRVTDLVRDIPSRDLTDGDAQLLLTWAGDVEHWNEQAVDLVKTKPVPPEPRGGSEAIRDALENARHANMILTYEHIAHGMHRHAYSIMPVASARPWTMRVSTSVEAEKAPRTYARDLHFEIVMRDLRGWYQQRKEGVSGVVLVPIERRGLQRVFSRAIGPLAFVPFSYLFRKGAFSITKCLNHYRGYAATLNLSLDPAGAWYFRMPGQRKKGVIATPCLETARALVTRRVTWGR